MIETLLWLWLNKRKFSLFFQHDLAGTVISNRRISDGTGARNSVAETSFAQKDSPMFASSYRWRSTATVLRGYLKSKTSFSVGVPTLEQLQESQ